MSRNAKGPAKDDWTEDAEIGPSKTSPSAFDTTTVHRSQLGPSESTEVQMARDNQSSQRAERTVTESHGKLSGHIERE